MANVVSKDQLADYVGKELGVSDWLKIDQDRINQFADATLDHQFIHVDPERAETETPFGSTIAHGYLTLSLTVHLMKETSLKLENMIMVINYGLNKLRFLQPVKVNSEIRTKVKILNVTERSPGQYLIASEVTVEIKGEQKPALVAETLALYIT
ncbi:MAG: MaoC family dehydratase [Alphaproteobacteria bacterium]|nr:MAG: MaoC family dehydratase [Alphaproteobacteria bacterium]